MIRSNLHGGFLLLDDLYEAPGGYTYFRFALASSCVVQSRCNTRHSSPSSVRWSSPTFGADLTSGLNIFAGSTENRFEQ